MIDIERLKVDADYWDEVAPEGATHCLIKDSGTAWFRFKDDNSFPNTWKDGEWKNVRLPTRELTPKPATKRLTQAVFDGLPPEYRWAAVGRTGKAFCFADRVNLHTYGYDSVTTLGCKTRLFIGDDYNTTNWQNSLIERQDVSGRVEQLRSIEEARKHSHYFKDVSGVDAIDLYHVAKLYEINDPALFHAFKKIACAGKRGAKDQAQDVQEAIDALKRWQELNK